MSESIHGRGASLPLRVAGGRIVESEGADKIAESIRIILETQPGERVMRPAFGCKLRSLAFAANSATTAGLARHYVEEALQRWEPRITVLSVGVQNAHAASALEITVCYRIKATRDERSLIYPFYLVKP